MDIVEEYNTQTIDLETHMGCLPTSDNSDSHFDLETFMNCLSSEGGDLPLGTWVDFCNADLGTLFTQRLQ